MLYREAFAASFTAALQYGAAAPRAHALAESVHLLAAAVVGLKRALHFEGTSSRERADLNTSVGVYPIPMPGVNPKPLGL